MPKAIDMFAMFLAAAYVPVSIADGRVWLIGVALLFMGGELRRVQRP